MSTPAPAWRFEYYALVLHPSEPRVLVRMEDNTYELPRVAVIAASADDAFAQMLGRFTNELGGSLTVLRWSARHVDEARRQVVAILIMECHRAAVQLPTDACWLGQEDLARQPLARRELHALVEHELRAAETGVVPPLRQPWARRGWYAEAVAWIAAQLAQLGTPLEAPIEQVRTWSLSCVLRAPTRAGDRYFKVAAQLPLFTHEPRVMAGLAALFPDAVPAPLVWDPDRRWMLLADLGRSLRAQSTVEAREAMLLRFGRLQLAAAPHVDHVLRIGCLDRRLAHLAGQIDPFLADTALLGDLTDAEVTQLRTLTPRLKAMCRALATYQVPATLVHGDLNLGNVALHNEQYMFFDWTDACVSHPFFDLLTAIWEDDQEVRARLVASYLQLWTVYEPMERLREAWALAEPLCSLHQAVSYQAILRHTEAAAWHEHAGMIAEMTRRVLNGCARLELGRPSEAAGTEGAPLPCVE